MENQRAGPKIIEDLRSKHSLEPLTRGLPKTIREAELQIEARTMAMKLTIAPKAAPSTSTLSGK
jgi:hypothetical protein